MAYSRNYNPDKDCLYCWAARIGNQNPKNLDEYVRSYHNFDNGITPCENHETDLAASLLRTESVGA